MTQFRYLRRVVLILIAGIALTLFILALFAGYFDRKLQWSYPQEETERFLSICNSRDDVTSSQCDCMWKAIRTNVSYQRWEQANKYYEATGTVDTELPDVFTYCQNE